MNIQVRLFALLIALTFFACSSEDDSNTPPPSNNTIEASIDEYPTSGDLVTTINSNLSGEVAFSITSQSISQAMGIDSNTGELRVLAWQVFDYETNPVITLTVNATNGTDTENKAVIISINDIDDIAAFLNNSRTAYDNAADGQWISITESEYNDLANYLAQVTKSGATDNHFSSTANIEQNSGNSLLANRNGDTMPEGSYIFAFKHYSWANNVSGSKVKLSQGDEFGTYESIGTSLPEHNAEYNHFVIKGNATATSTEAHLAIFANNSIGYKSISGTTYGWGDGGDTNMITNGNINAVFLYQGLSTTMKQWD
ncbi:cadherin repeat domain-containing protein [uncultured Psychroserpens sp.]|uniref:cadherin repeat domain-containing protein n=1 Tax=uncultured Psychroserpens sp. TaxID=255436 RepID=UPI00262A5941|nr:cadherin repeat domain-containing protein [uncultured Psychroserpens sp.]